MIHVCIFGKNLPYYSKNNHGDRPIFESSTIRASAKQAVGGKNFWNAFYPLLNKFIPSQNTKVIERITEGNTLCIKTKSKNRDDDCERIF